MVSSVDKRTVYYLCCDGYCVDEPICTESNRKEEKCIVLVRIDPAELTDYEQRKEDEIYARIGRAVEEWLEEIQGWLAYAVYGNAQPRSLIVELADIIAKAREGEGK